MLGVAFLCEERANDTLEAYRIGQDFHDLDLNLSKLTCFVADTGLDNGNRLGVDVPLKGGVVGSIHRLAVLHERVAFLLIGRCVLRRSCH